MQDNDGYTPLMTYLCNYKYKINDENDNKYTEANFERDYDMIKLLLKHGANPNLKNSDGCTIFDFLMINKIYKSIHIIKIIKLLLENNINIDTYNIHGYALLHYYICEKKYDIVKFLIKDCDLEKEVLEKIFTSCGFAEKDEVIILAKVHKGNKSWIKEKLVKSDDQFSAMQKATAFPISSVAAMMANGKLEGNKDQHRDYWTQYPKALSYEHVPFKEFDANLKKLNFNLDE